MKRFLTAGFMALVALLSVTYMAAAHPDHPHPSKDPDAKAAPAN